MANARKAEPGTEKATNGWDRRWCSVEAPREPASLLVQFSALLPPCGRALDVAAGAGRNSAYLATCGLRVVAVDRSRTGLERGKALAREKGVRIHWVQADLENLVLPPSSFDVITCFYYRDPALYPRLGAALRPGGLIFFGLPGPPNRERSPGELLAAFRAFAVVFYHESWKGRGVASLVARKRGRSEYELASRTALTGP